MLTYLCFETAWRGRRGFMVTTDGARLNFTSQQNRRQVNLIYPTPSHEYITATCSLLSAPCSLGFVFFADVFPVVVVVFAFSGFLFLFAIEKPVCSRSSSSPPPRRSNPSPASSTTKHSFKSYHRISHPSNREQVAEMVSTRRQHKEKQEWASRKKTKLG